MQSHSSREDKQPHQQQEEKESEQIPSKHSLSDSPQHGRCSTYSQPHLQMPKGDDFSTIESALNHKNSLNSTSITNKTEQKSKPCIEFEGSRRRFFMQLNSTSDSVGAHSEDATDFADTYDFLQEYDDALGKRSFYKSPGSKHERLAECAAGMKFEINYFLAELPMLLEYLNLEDVCRLKIALNNKLSVDARNILQKYLLKLIWKPETLLMKSIFWDAFVRFSKLKIKYPQLYQTYHKNPCEVERSIRLDIDRTFPNLEHFESVSNQNILTRVLRALSHSIKRIGYMQGWNQVVGVFLLYPDIFDEESVFWIVTYMMHERMVKDMFISVMDDDGGEQLQRGTDDLSFADKENNWKSMNQSKGLSFDRCIGSQYNAIEFSLDLLNFAFKMLIKTHLRNVADILVDLEFQIYTQQWFLTLFTRSLPPEMSLRVMAGVLVDGVAFLLRVALALMSCIQADIVQVKDDPDEVMAVLAGVTNGNIEISNEMVIQGIQKFEVSGQEMSTIQLQFHRSNIRTSSAGHVGMFKSNKMLRKFREGSNLDDDSRKSQFISNSVPSRKLITFSNCFSSEKVIHNNNNNNNFQEGVKSNQSLYLKHEQWIEHYFKSSKSPSNIKKNIAGIS